MIELTFRDNQTDNILRMLHSATAAVPDSNFTVAAMPSLCFFLVYELIFFLIFRIGSRSFEYPI